MKTSQASQSTRKLAEQAKITVANKYHKIPDGPNQVNVMRPNPLGNPFRIGDIIVNGDGTSTENTRELVIKKYAHWLDIMIQQKNCNVIKALEEIADKAISKDGVTLICCCAPKPCHADIIKKKVIELLEMIDEGRL